MRNIGLYYVKDIRVFSIVKYYLVFGDVEMVI